MRREWMQVLLLLGLSLCATPVLAQVLPGATVEERAITGAKEYIKKKAFSVMSFPSIVGCGRQEQIKLWRSGVASGAYIDRF